MAPFDVEHVQLDGDGDGDGGGNRVGGGCQVHEPRRSGLGRSRQTIKGPVAMGGRQMAVVEVSRLTNFHAEVVEVAKQAATAVAAKAVDFP